MSDKIRLDPAQLTPRDLKRAQVALKGQNPWELLEDPLDALILTIFCLRSRDDPEFTYEDALDVPLGDFELVNEEEPPPPSPATPSLNGSPAASESGKGRKPSRSSAASTT